MARDRSPGSKLVQVSIVGVLAVLGLLMGFSILTQHHVDVASQRAEQANRISSIYQDARFWVGQEESLERKYRLEPASTVLGLYRTAEQRVADDLRRLARVDESRASTTVVAGLVALHVRYQEAARALFRAVDGRDLTQVIYLDHAVVDPVFGTMQNIVYTKAGGASNRAVAQSATLRRSEADASGAIVTAFALAVAVLLGAALVVAKSRRRLDAAQAAEVKRLSEVAITDPLTGLRNHRAFHEDLGRSLHRVGRTGMPTSLVLLDLNGLKALNDTLGQQAGDERLQALATAIRSTERGSDCAYRIGGDEFAVILDGTRAWDALTFAQRLKASQAQTSGEPATASAGISEALGESDKDTLIREADLARLAAKRSGQDAAIYTPEMESQAPTVDSEERHTQTLANALALAVDAKDSYTRSHCQTVSQLCALIGTELGYDASQLTSIRLAGLLHDVGKIGVPDAILNKPTKLTAGEYEQMKAHSILGYDIVSAAEMPIEARWIRHHHERYDGDGYPDRLRGEAIPRESRIIFVADAFEAMTSDRPYRKAPGHDFAVAELRRNAGTQFDPRAVDALCRTLQRSPGHAAFDPRAATLVPQLVGV